MCICFTLILSISCCEDNQHKELNSIQIVSKDLKTETISLKDIIDDVDIIPLETNDMCLINNVGKLTVTEKGFLITNWGAKDKVLRFSENGKFLNQVGRLGHGRGEYSYLLDVSTNREGSKIAICTPEEIITYNNEGEFIQRKHIFEDAYIKQLAMTPQGLLCSTHFTGDKYQLHLLDDNFSIINEIIPTDNSIISLPSVSGNHISILNSKLCYCDYYNSCIYIIEFNGAVNKVKQYKFIDKDFIHYDNSNAQKYTSCEDFAYIYGFKFDGDYIEGTIVDKYQKGYRCKINVNTDEIIKYNYNEWIPEILDIYENCYYCIISQNMFLDIVKGKMYPSNYLTQLIREKNDELQLGVNENSNYVILKFRKYENL